MEIIKGRTLEYGQLVQVYQNLNRDCFSIKDKRSGLVVAYAKTVTLKTSTLKISESGRLRVLERQVRNVHAVLEGQFICADRDTPPEAVRVAYYNPYTTPTFIDEHTKETVSNCTLAHCSNKRVYFI